MPASHAAADLTIIANTGQVCDLQGHWYRVLAAIWQAACEHMSKSSLAYALPILVHILIKKEPATWHSVDGLHSAPAMITPAQSMQAITSRHVQLVASCT